MAKGVKVQVLGTSKVLRNIKKETREVENEIPNSLAKISLFLEGEVKQSIAGRRGERRSVDTGRFLNSVSSRSTVDAAEVFTNLDYAAFLEFGTSRLSPRNHFRNSFFRNKKKIVQDLRIDLRKKII